MFKEVLGHEGCSINIRSREVGTDLLLYCTSPLSTDLLAAPLHCTTGDLHLALLPPVTASGVGQDSRDQSKELELSKIQHFC